MLRTGFDPDADPHRTMSMFIVPRHADGVEVREVGLMHDPESKGLVHTHAEVHYRDVRVSPDHLLGGVGDGFSLAQARLGPGRIHHTMRWIGVSRRAFDALCERAVSKSVHGSVLSDKQTIQNWVADCAAQIESTRLLTLHAAWKMDRVGPRNARTEIAMIKYHGAKAMHDVLDRAIQIHGSLGFSCDMPLEKMYRWARASRLYDGPDEVHRVTVARRILRNYQPRDLPSDHIPTRRERAIAKYRDELEALRADPAPAAG
jgi:acyl-CoA dehydrogenase